MTDKDRELVDMLRRYGWPEAADRIEALAAKVAQVVRNAQQLRCAEHSLDASNAWGCPGCIESLRNELKMNAGMLARQTDLARQAEADAMAATRRAERAEATASEATRVLLATRAIIDAVYDMLDNEADIEDGAEGPRPNAAMRYRDAIEAIERQRGDA